MGKALGAGCATTAPPVSNAEVIKVRDTSSWLSDCSAAMRTGVAGCRRAKGTKRKWSPSHRARVFSPDVCGVLVPERTVRRVLDFSLPWPLAASLTATQVRRILHQMTLKKRLSEEFMVQETQGSMWAVRMKP